MLFRSIVDRGVSKRRRNDSFPGFPLTSLLDCFQCVRHDEHISRGSLGSAVPPFGCAFSTARGMQGVLAVANEEGIVRLYNTENRKSPVLQEWMAHENAVFDVAWVPGEASLVTASGDQMAKLWDVKSQNLLGTFKGHQCSVKSVSFTQQEKSVFCSGGRDGNIMIWDTRCSKKDGFYRQVKQISGAHNKMDAHTPSQMKKKRLGQRGRAPSVDSQQSVTVVLFCDEHTLISTGAVDGIIKMWDLRKNYTAHLHDPTPLLAYPYPGASTRKLGYSGLVSDSSGANLFANCTDDNVYMFNISGVKTSPVAVFSGHRNSSFYVKSTISPDDQFLASGSSDHHTYIWKISEPKQAPVMLQGHSQEVTSIAWCPTDFTKIASCSDDNTVRIWRLDRGMGGAKSSVGEANLVGWACSGPTSTLSSSRPLNQADHTPSKNLRTDPLESLSSPLPAACAPSVAALPLPSTTSSPTQTQGAKAIRPHLRTPTSIRQWCSRTAPRDQASPPLRQVLSPCPQSPVPGTPPSERRAKRRLETGSGASGSCGGMRNCDCVTELYPTAKRSRPLLGMCCAQEGSTTETEKILEAGELRMGEQKLSNQADKENSSLEVVDWLSVMGRMLKEGTGSPNSPKSPGASKRPDGRTPPSLSYSPNAMKKISSYFQRVNPN